MSQQKIAILGASRGLGRSFSERLLKEKAFGEVFLSSRKAFLLEEVEEVMKMTDWEGEAKAYDFSKEEDQEKLVKELKIWGPDQLFYFAGGGPYGEYLAKEWKDHHWALQVSLVFPMKLFSHLQKSLKKFVVVGSSVAENQADPNSASYAAAKHGLKGWHSSVAAEACKIDFRLFSPGYMDTALLPLGAEPRQQGQVMDPAQVAEDLWLWSQEDKLNHHFIYDEY